MTLRDIFEKISDIYNFNYEKNRNGSYRVNTVIRELMYPSLYEDRDFNDQEIGYFIKYTEFSFSDFPNIKNSFTELMKPKEASNRFPILEFAKLIEIEKLYEYYTGLNAALEEDKKTMLIEFITEILSANPMLNTKLRIICSEPHEFLSWIIIYSMFNSAIAEEKYVTFNKSVGISSEKTINHLFSNILKKKNNNLVIFNFTLVTLTIVEILAGFIPYIFSDYYSRQSVYIQNGYTLIITVYSMIVLLTWILHARYTYHIIELKNYYSNNQDNLDEKTINSLSRFMIWKNKEIKEDNIPTSELQKKRIKIRKYSVAAICICCAISAIPGLIYESFPLFVSLGVVVITADIWIDRILNDKRVRKYYDSLSLKDESQKPNALRGVAKIYAWEYRKTGFNFNDDYYKTSVPYHSNECYHNIFIMAYDRIKWKISNRYLLILYFNFFLVILGLLINIFPSSHAFLKLPEDVNTQLIILIYMMSAGIFCIISAVTNERLFSGLSALKQAITNSEASSSDTEKTFLLLQNENLIGEIDITRGIFTYNISQFEKGILIDNIAPESDRMLFYHRIPTFNNFANFNLLVSEIIFNILISWHFQLYGMFFLISTGLLIICYLVKKLVSPRLHKKRIIRAIRKL